MKTKIKNNLVYFFILFFIGLGLVSCGKKKNEVKEKNKIIIESFDYEMNENEVDSLNLSYNLSFNIDLSFDKKTEMNDFAVKVEGKKAFHITIDYCNTEAVELSNSREPDALLNYSIPSDVHQMEVTANLRITTNDLIDDINRFLKIYIIEKENCEIVDNSTQVEDGCFKMIYSSSSDFYYEYNEFSESYKIVSVIKKTEKIDIPSEYNHHPVKEIAPETFDALTETKELSLPNTLISIPKGLLAKMQKLRKLTFPMIIPYLYYLFGGSNYVPQSLKEVIISGGESIGIDAFSYCSSLTSITIADSITSIGESAFVGCSSLINIDIPTSVTHIGVSAFNGCSSLESITIPFVGASLNGAENTHFGYIFGASTYQENSKYVPRSLINVIITGGESIGDSAFEDCSSLTNITIPNSVTDIGSYAFYDCTSLTSIVIPNSVTSIADSAFSSCSSLTSITIPNSVTSIGISAFEGCSRLTSITIPNGVTIIGVTAFYNCSSLTSITIPNSVTSIGDGAFLGCSSVTSITIPNSVTNIANSSFESCSSLTSIAMGNNVTSIGDSAFSGCSSITNILIPNSVTSIGEKAFFNCNGLASIVIPNSVTSIGLNSFSVCESLTNVYYEGTIEDWCSGPFTGATLFDSSNSNHFYLRNSNDEWEEVTRIEIPNTITEICADQFNGFNNVTSITIPESVISIGWASLSGCSKLTSITIPDSVTNIGRYAFNNCHSLTSITIPFVGASLNETENTHFGYIFGAGTYSYNSNYVPSSLKEVIITTGGESIGQGAFLGCSSLAHINFGNSITSIGNSAFLNCSSLTNVVIPESVTSIGEYAFSSCSSLTNIVIPNSVTSIGASTFNGCSSLESITIPFVGASINETENTHFGYIFGAKTYNENSKYVSSSLKQVVITGGENIGSYAFFDCGSLTSITIPESVNSIENYAFYRCSNLQYNEYSNGYYLGNEENPYLAFIKAISKDIITCEINSGTKFIYNHAFSDCNNLINFIVPENIISIGRYAFSYCRSLTSITIPFVGASLNETENTHFGYIFGASTYEDNPTYVPSSLKEVRITKGESIDLFAFYKCSNLTSITLPNSIKNVGESAFSNCSCLKDVYYEGTLEQWCKLNCRIFYSSSNSNHFYLRNSNDEWEEVTSIEIPNTITKIGDYQFYGFNNVTSFTIPNSVTNIGESAFEGCGSLISIVISNSVSNIGHNSFNYCESLTNVYYEGTIEGWCTGPFTGATLFDSSNSNHFYIRNSNNEWEEVTRIEIPNTITEIGADQFNGFNNVTSITIPDSVLSIGESGFEGCSSLISIIIPNSVSNIGHNSFSYCESLTNVYYEGTIEDWCSGPFTGATLFDSSNSNHFYIRNNNEEWEEATSIEIPNTIIKIGEYQFYGFNNVTSITIPNSVISIGSSAFSGCDNLVKATIPTIAISSITKSKLKEVIITGGESIGAYAFSNCNSLTSITIPESVTSIGDNVFADCSSLTSIRIPNSVTSIGDNVFVGCSNLKYYEKDEGYYLGNEENPYLVFVKTKSTNITSCEFAPNTRFIYSFALNNCETLISLSIPNCVISIGESAFSNCSSLTNITIPDSVKSIGKSAFSNCSNLESLTIPFVGASSNGVENTHFGYIFGASIYIENSKYVPRSLFNVNIAGGESIGDSAFSGCSSLTSLTIPDSVTSIGKSAFENCISLTNVTIPNSVSNIGHNSFSYCESLNNVYYEGTIEDWCNGPFTGATLFDSSNSNHFYIRNSNGEWEEVTSIEIPNTITEIGADQFNGFNNVTSITIPESVISLGYMSFSNCSSLASITIPFVGASLNETENTYFGYIFGASTYNENFKYVPRSLLNVIITGGESIGDSAFYACSSLTSITIPDSVTSIGNRALSSCSSLTSITIPFLGASLNETENTHFGYIFGASKYSYNSNYVPSSLKEVVITGGENIGSYAFFDCSSLTSITIPDSVTSIGKYAFQYCSSLVSITIPDSVTSIGKYAFQYCSSLASITIPDSVTSIGSSAFEDCPSLTSVYFDGTIEDWCSGPFTGATLFDSSNSNHFYIRNNNEEWEEATSIEIPNTIIKIGDYQFYGFNNVTSITIPNSVTSISISAFFGCDNLDKATIPTIAISSITKSKLKEVIITGGESIGAYAFQYCSSLASITIPDSVTSIGIYAFEDCRSLTSVYFDGTIEDWSQIKFGNSESSTPMRYANHFYIRNSNNEWEEVSSIEIPNTETEIGAYQFYGFNNVTSVTIPDSVTRIGSSAFSGCDNLVKATIPTIAISSITKSKLKEVIITDGKSIEAHAFSGCSSLTSITIPDSVTSIGSSAFSGCGSLTSITIPEGVTSIKEYTFSECVSLTSITIPNRVISIGWDAFLGCSSLASIVISNSVFSIGDAAFTNCSSLTNVYYEGTIQKWCKINFKNTSSNPMSNASHFYLKNSNNEWEEVTSIEISNTETEIGAYQFYGFNNVTSITIPESVISLGYMSFSNCSSLASITIPFVGASSNGAENTHFGYIFGASTYNENFKYVPRSLLNVIIIGGESIGDSAFYACSSLTSLTIPNSVTSIGNWAFNSCSSLTSITIPDSVTSIGDYAFQYCSSLTSITIPDSVTSIGKYAFQYCSSLTSITIPDSVTSIGKYAFRECSSLIGITIPNSVTSIEEFTFFDCTSLTSITIPNRVTSIGGWAFNGCSSLVTMTIGNSVISIEHHAFYDCSSLISITIPDSVTSIGDAAFYNCNSLTNIVIANSVTSIGDSVFYGCSNILNATIPTIAISSIPRGKLKEVVITGGESIGNGAFYNCSSLTNIVIANSVTSIGASTFNGCSSLESITIGNNVTSIDDRAFYDCTSLANVYYEGISDGWKNVSIGSSNSSLTTATIYYYSETMPTEEGNYWHYVNGVATKW